MKKTWTCYLATPIDQVMVGTWEEDIHGMHHEVPSGRLIEDVRDTLRATLEAHGAAVYDPVRTWQSTPLPAMSEVNEAALVACDALLAYLPDGVPSIGVPLEVERAWVRNQPTVVLGGDAVMNSPMWPPEPGSVGRMDIDVVNLDVVVEGLKFRAEGLRRTPILDKDTQWVPGTMKSIPTARPKMTSQEDVAVAVAQGDRRVFDQDTVQAMDPVRAVLDTSGFLNAVKIEVDRANIKHPYSEQHGVTRWFGIWAEEVFEVFKAWNDHQNPEGFTEDATLQSLATELVQVGAMSLRFWQSVVTGSESDER